MSITFLLSSGTHDLSFFSKIDLSLRCLSIDFDVHRCFFRTGSRVRELLQIKASIGSTSHSRKDCLRIVQTHDNVKGDILNSSYLISFIKTVSLYILLATISA